MVKTEDQEVEAENLEHDVLDEQSLGLVYLQSVEMNSIKCEVFFINWVQCSVVNLGLHNVLFIW